MSAHSFAFQIQSLTDYLEDQEAEELRLREMLADVENRCQRARKAIEILTDGPSPSVKASKAPAKKKAAKTKRYRPRQANVETVLAAFQDGEAHTITEIIQSTPLSSATVRTAVAYLREEQMIRKTGRVQRGRMKVDLYAPMPQVIQDAA
jgi:septal ring factor EnvC (AmiA/AmiB activator)